jgi:quercetin dioxygenase-like cupin family protein
LEDDMTEHNLPGAAVEASGSDHRRLPPWRVGLAAVALAATLLGITAYAAVSQTIAVGTMAHSDLVGGPATILMRTLTIAPGEVLGWHYHPGVGAYTIVRTGALIVEDGCGEEVMYTAGQAFLEPPGRVHRGKNPTSEEVVTAQTFIVPTGTPTSVATDRLCGPPASTQECKGGGWMSFTHPRNFINQGDCEQYVLTGR